MKHASSLGLDASGRLIVVVGAASAEGAIIYRRLGCDDATYEEDNYFSTLTADGDGTNGIGGAQGLSADSLGYVYVAGSTTDNAYKAMEAAYIETFREEIIEDFWEDQSLTLYGVVGEAIWSYMDLEHPEVAKTIQSIHIPVESTNPVAGVIYPEGGYAERSDVHTSGETDTPAGALQGSGIFVNEGDRDWMTEYYDDEGDMFDSDVESRRISKVSCYARGYEFRLSLKVGDIFDDTPGKCVVTMPTVKFRMRSE